MKISATAMASVVVLLLALNTASANNNIVTIKPSVRPNIAPQIARPVTIPRVTLDRLARKPVGAKSVAAKLGSLPVPRLERMVREPAKKVLDRGPVDTRKAKRFRDAERIRAAAEAQASVDAARIAVEPAQSGRFSDPLGKRDRTSPAARKRPDSGLIRGRRTAAPDAASDPGLPRNDPGASVHPGTRPGTSSIPRGNMAGNDDGEAARTTHREGDTETTKTVHDDGRVAITSETLDETGYFRETTTYGEDGQADWRFQTIETSGGARREIATDMRYGWRSVTDYGRDGDRIGERRSGGLDRTQTGEEGGASGWCPPSGWGCKASPVAGARAGGRRERPDPEGEASTTAGPRLSQDPHGVVVNPDIYRDEGGQSFSARSFDGGKLVNPPNPTDD
jgi:hypothetical protein